ncbi:MAG: PorT family protein [Bacteroidia bacterium]|nr:PorT family protein [Bacteroidia bacterium]MDW8088867.1 porin family protein [Bacteroidia bacterium]
MRGRGGVLLALTGAIWAQDRSPVWFGVRGGMNWGQYRNVPTDEPPSRSYWGGGFHGGIGVQQSLGARTPWAIQGELTLTQRRSTDRNLLYDYRYTLWGIDFTVLGVWRWLRKFEGFFLEFGPTSTLLLAGRYWQRNNLTGQTQTRRVEFGRGERRDVRRGEIALNAGLGAGYPVGPGYLVFGLRFWHGLNNLAGGAYKSWHNYGVLTTLTYWYDPQARDK